MKILFAGAVLLLFIVFLLFSYPRLILLYIKTTKGKYSHAYLSRFKKYFNKNPYGYCVKEDFIDRVLPFIKRNSNAALVQISENRLPLNYPWFTTFKKLRNREGKPVCFQAYKKYGIDFKIIGYSSNIHGTKAKSLYYFADKLLFMTEFIISGSSPDATDEMLDFLSGGQYSARENFKYLYLELNENESIFIRDAAFSLILASLNNNHPHIKQVLDKIGREYRQLWQNLEKK